MANTNQEKFLDIFKTSLKIDARTISIRTLLSERNLKRITHNPYYQRNYVWDKVKQSFFIESVILGTEIPPLIFYKSGLKIEIIDGRQRFETLKRFTQNEIKFDGRGLMTLDALIDKSIVTLDDKLRETFWSSNIRIFEFQVVNYPELSEEVEDKIKKEIFRRYNTGITPLTSIEVDNAKYLHDKLTDHFNKLIESEPSTANEIAATFLGFDGKEVPKADISNFLRRLYILNRYPISKYAGGSNRVETVDILYDFAVQDLVGTEEEDQDRYLERVKQEYDKYIKRVKDVIDIRNFFVKDNLKLKNKLIYESLLWAIRVLDKENISFTIDRDALKRFYIEKIASFVEVDYFFYGHILNRFNVTADYFSKITGYDFSLFIKKPNFTKELKQEITRRTDANVLESFDNLRYNKPAPISTPIDEILTDVSQNKYLIRPSYQREEKITLLKASSIIESILLGIALPPIFIFKRLDGVKEVIDGQQRLLSILGFLGKAYRSEKNELMFSKHNNYKLKGLEILSGLNGTSYQKLSEDFSEKLLDFAIDVIIIEEALNKDFEPTDLFIRLNNKPYPIKSNSFEMWNSTIDTKVIQTIKTVTNKHIEWFFIKETDIDPEERNDRMENEEFVTILAYLIYNSLYDSYDKIIGFFKKSDALSCRLVYKTGLTDFLGRLEQEEKEKEVFLNCIILTEKIITNLGMALGQDRPTKENLNTFLNVSNKPTYRRSLQDFYIIWIYLISFSQPHLITEDKLGTMIELLKYFRNTKGDKVDDKFVENFHKKLKSFYPSENVN